MLAIKDLPRMTNAQLQAELKKRGLAESGKKAELVERLSESIRKEEDALLNADADSTDLAGDALLAESLLDEENPDPTTTTTGSQSTAPTGGKTISADNEEKKKKIEDDSNDAKIKRAQRFGLPIGSAASVTSTDSKQKRAERFGIANEPTTEEAKAKRAARFGLPVNESNDSPVLVSAEAKAKRAARFGTTVESAEDKDKLLARAQRFGIPVSVDGKRSAADPELEAKKKARAERFGLSE